ncbi:hypothetical protein FRC10_009232 [Ceratobasidium sp. 414]|nr:hypothetical protein FRC10_009232 [Ceratobasidium sp. 414]
MLLTRGLGAVPDSVDVHDFDYNNHNFNEDLAEAIVADNNQESFESDENDVADPLVHLQSAISKICKIAKIVRSSPQCMELFRKIAELIEDHNEQTAREDNRKYKKKKVKTLILFSM